MKRRHFLGAILNADTGRIYHGRALDDVQRRQVISRAAYLAYERRVHARRFVRRVVIFCALAMAACVALSNIVHHFKH